MSELKIRIDENKTGGKIHSYHLMTSRGSQQFSGGSHIMSADEMRQIAAALIDKANEIDRIDVCPKCKNKMDIDQINDKSMKPLYIYFWCQDCDAAYDYSGEVIK